MERKNWSVFIDLKTKISSGGSLHCLIKKSIATKNPQIAIPRKTDKQKRSKGLPKG
jgi:hypothetical protein